MGKLSLRLIEKYHLAIKTIQNKNYSNVTAPRVSLMKKWYPLFG